MEGNGRDSLIKDMVEPLSWETARLHLMIDPPTEVLLRLPGAIHKAGGLITDLNIELSPPEDLSDFTPSEKDLHDVTSAVQRLKHFNFILRSEDLGFWAVRDPVEINDLRRFLVALLDTASIEEMDLNCSALWNKQALAPPAFTPHALGPIITS
jgi:hypothetical protein